MRVGSVSNRGSPKLDDVEHRRESQSPCAAPGIPSGQRHHVIPPSVPKRPYPHWVTPDTKAEIIALVERMVADARAGSVFDRQSPELRKLDGMFAFSSP
jgi:hypothetical protein